MQQLLVSNITIEIPPEFVILSRAELEELQEQQLVGTYWSMKELEKRTNKKHEWIKENILYPNRYREELDVDNGGFVFYPKSRGQTWSFHAPRMAEFLDKHFQEIFAGSNQS